MGMQLLACNSYNVDVLESPRVCGDGHVDVGELCDTAIEQGEPGACPRSCSTGSACAPRMMIGTGCQRQCAEVRIKTDQNGDGCCLEGSTPERDSDCGSCGDGVIGPGESCDPPGKCPSARSCATQEACLVGMYSGRADNCTARCELRVIEDCRSEDGCCPPGCTPNNDSDCTAPMTCGNGTVDESAGETCEGRDCPTRCDDSMACTLDLLTGSAATCTARCMNPPITQPENGDMCCPPGANAQSDSDCPPVCGNGVPEPGEECDGGDLCTEACRVITPQQRQCLALPTTASPQCQACQCMKCAEPMIDCYQSGDAMRDPLCSAVIECSNRTGCVLDACFCGTSSDCVSSRNGPCETEIAAAANSNLRNTVAMCSNTMTCPLYWSRQVGECRAMECAAECALQESGATAPPR